MKRILLTTIVSIAAVGAFGQGAIDVGNNFGASVFRAPIYGPEVGNPGLSIRGQSGAPAVPTGTTVYTGARLLGTGFRFVFYASTTGITADVNGLSPLATLAFGTTAGTAGFVVTSTVNVPGVTAGNTTTWQIRAWDLSTGATWEEATVKGTSPLVNSGPLGGVTTGGPVLNASTASGWTSFNIYAVPEPSTFVLAGLGVASLLIFRRRK